MTKISNNPMIALRTSASEPICITRDLSCLPKALAISVWVPIPRKLNIQKMLESAVVPTPTAAKGIDPRRETNAVSNNPVSGSAIKDNKTGNDMDTSVKWGDLTNGCWRGVVFCVSTNLSVPWLTLRLCCREVYV